MRDDLRVIALIQPAGLFGAYRPKVFLLSRRIRRKLAGMEIELKKRTVENL